MSKKILRRLMLVISIMCLSIGIITGCSKEDSNKSESQALSEKSEKPENKNTIKFTDLAGKEVELDKIPERIFLTFYQESYLAVNGNFDNVVCMSMTDWEDFFNNQYKVYLENMPELKNMKDVGSIYKGSLDMEAVLESKPEVAIFSQFHYDSLGEENVKKLESSGIKIVVIDYNAQTLEKHLQSTEILGKITGNEERAKELSNKYKEIMSDIESRVSDIKEEDKKKIYIELANKGAEEIGNSYGDYMWGAVSMLAGGNNIAYGKVDSYNPLSPEYILEANPDTIIFSGSKWTNDTGNRVVMGFGVTPEETSERIKPYLERNGWNNINAVKNGEVYAVDHAGLRSIFDCVYIQFMGKAMYPDKFEDVNPEETLKELYEKYLPINPDGTFMTKYINK